MRVHVDVVLTGVDSADMIEKMSQFIVGALLTHVACVDCVDTSDKEIQVLRQALSWR